MLTWLSNIPIFQRLFLAFALAALLPAIIIVRVLGVSIQFLGSHGGQGLASSLQSETVIAVCASIVIVLVVGFLVNLTITRPLSQLAALSRKIRHGDTSARAGVVGHDEISIVATSINSMLDDIGRLVRETQGEHDYLHSQIERLVNEVSGVGEGDLRIQAAVTHESLGVLADSFNYMVEELSNLVIRVKSVAVEVENSTTATQQQMNRLVSTAMTQLQQINVTSRTIETMAEESLQVAERTQVLQDIARRARQGAQSGRTTVAQTLDGIGRIQANVQQTARQVQGLDERSQEINEIVEVITAIVNQTNRLALDAAIQAAMAGAHGKGFGAVAEDIRRLAERTKEQMSTITRIVKSARNDIELVSSSMHETERETSQGVHLAQGTEATISMIFSVVEQQAREIEQINTMMGHLFRSLQEVAAIMQGVSEVTQQGSSSTRMVAQEMQGLAHLAKQLRVSVEAFKLKDAVELGSGTDRSLMVSNGWPQADRRTR